MVCFKFCQLETLACRTCLPISYDEPYTVGGCVKETGTEVRGSELPFSYLHPNSGVKVPRYDTRNVVPSDLRLWALLARPLLHMCICTHVRVVMSVMQIEGPITVNAIKSYLSLICLPVPTFNVNFLDQLPGFTIDIVSFPINPTMTLLNE